MNQSVASRIFDVFNIILMALLAFICLYPMVYVLFSSVSNPSFLMMRSGLMLWPAGFTLEGYALVFRNPIILTAYRNTAIYLFAGTAIQIVMTSIAAYVLSRRTFFFRNAMAMIIVFTMYFSGGMIPFYLTVKETLGLYNNIWPMILPGAISTWNLIIMRTSFRNIPESLEESAHLDGAGHLTVLFRIIIPLSLPVMAVMVLYYAVGHWNSWFNALLFLRDRSLFPLQLILREILIANSTTEFMEVTQVDQTMKDDYRLLVQYATIIVATVPILLSYPFLQRYFIKGIMIGAIKG